MGEKPLTDEEIQQRRALAVLVLGPPGRPLVRTSTLIRTVDQSVSESAQLLDDDVADDIRAWTEGYGERPAYLDS